MPDRIPFHVDENTTLGELREFCDRENIVLVQRLEYGIGIEVRLTVDEWIETLRGAVAAYEANR